ncbi:MAG: hypothetical protein OXL37_02540 [Chloroflexota bacterium]|nr:hypothetical protein [Chloroflexota bacterium]MDE2960387.1 hypothetical protein [Chloroflexota bacterium]
MSKLVGGDVVGRHIGILLDNFGGLILAKQIGLVACDRLRAGVVGKTDHDRGFYDVNDEFLSIFDGA